MSWNSNIYLISTQLLLQWPKEGGRIAAVAEGRADVPVPGPHQLIYRRRHHWIPPPIKQRLRRIERMEGAVPGVHRAATGPLKTSRSANRSTVPAVYDPESGHWGRRMHPLCLIHIRPNVNQQHLYGTAMMTQKAPSKWSCYPLIWRKRRGTLLLHLLHRLLRHRLLRHRPLFRLLRLLQLITNAFLALLTWLQLTAERRWSAFCLSIGLCKMLPTSSKPTTALHIPLPSLMR